MSIDHAISTQLCFRKNCKAKIIVTLIGAFNVIHFFFYNSYFDLSLNEFFYNSIIFKPESFYHKSCRA